MELLHFVPATLQSAMGDITMVNLAAEVAARLGENQESQVETIRVVLQNACSGKMPPTKVLTVLLQLAHERGLNFYDLFQTPTLTPFSLLRPSRTLTYLGGYGDGGTGRRSFVGPVTISLFDLFAARRAARRLTRDFRCLRIARSLSNTAEELRRYCESELLHARDIGSDGLWSMLSLGSGRSNSMSEFLLCRAFDIPPFGSGGCPTMEVPFRFQFAEISGGQRRSLSHLQSAFGSYSASPGAATSLYWSPDQTSHEYVHAPERAPLADRSDDLLPPQPRPGEDGRDFAIISVHRTGESIGDVVVAGLRGIGTFGGSALLCDCPDRFRAPPSIGDVTVYLVEVSFQWSEDLAWATHARIVRRWARTGHSAGPMAVDNHDSLWHVFQPER